MGLSEFIDDIQVTNRTNYNWGPGFYLAPVEKRKEGEDFMVHTTHNLEPIHGGGCGIFRIEIEVFARAKPSKEWHAVEMSFFESNGNPIG